VLVTYVNPSRKATFGDGAAKITRIELTFADGSTKEIEGNVICGSDARDVRNRKVRRIVATMD
jgi:hypothetical protein